MVPVRVPAGTLEDEPKLSERDYNGLRELMHRMYGPDQELHPPDHAPPSDVPMTEPAASEPEDGTAPKRW